MSQPALSSIMVAGFKSFGSPQTIAIRPLTILAGANNSGKSSIMQPLLLLKQTLLSPVDPGGLRLQGPLLKMAAGEFWHRDRQARTEFHFELRCRFSDDATAAFRFEARLEGAIAVSVGIHSSVTNVQFPQSEPAGPAVILDRFLPRFDPRQLQPISVEEFATILQRLIHLPAVRRLDLTEIAPGIPEAIEDRFDSYVAPIVRSWQKSGSAPFRRLQRALEFLSINVQVENTFAGPEVQVTMFPEEQEHRRVYTRVAKVGFGVTQALPIVVALIYAEPGDLVHIEEPDAHLHPKAQIGLTRLIAEAANRGVRVVIETHSSLMLREVQTLVASGSLSPDSVKLHWFQRDPDSFETRVTSATLDEQGTFGDWPEDFDEVNLDSEKRFLDATFSRSRS